MMQILLLCFALSVNLVLESVWDVAASAQLVILRESKLPAVTAYLLPLRPNVIALDDTIVFLRVGYDFVFEEQYRTLDISEASAMVLYFVGRREEWHLVRGVIYINREAILFSGAISTR